MSVNKVILVGTLGKDPELRYTPAGAAVATFSLATSERYKDKSGEMQEKTEWHNIVAWRQLAEICGKYLHKGKQIYIEGRIQTRSYDDKDGNKRYITEIVADQMQMLGRVGEENGGQTRAGGESRQSRPASQAGGQRTPAYEDFAEPPFNPDDDIPF
jgi:single-strand DNA-binding protein